MTELKVCICGDTNTGKTTYLNSLLGNINQETSPTPGLEVYPIVFRITYNEEGVDLEEDIRINFWDIAGDDNYGGLRDCYFIRADGVLLFDRVNTKTRLNMWIKICNQVLHSNVINNKVMVVPRIVGEVDEDEDSQNKRINLCNSKNMGLVNMNYETELYLPIERLLKKIYQREDVRVLYSV